MDQIERANRFDEQRRRLRAERTRREQPLESYLPEPIVVSEPGADPEHDALLAEQVGIALQVVLEALPPAERLAFVLHDMFAVPFEEIVVVLTRIGRMSSSVNPAEASLAGSTWILIDGFCSPQI